jgi:GalNAc-alpha-(1->4)-GalNAc-alpha-(1->3)-diNAcBac-PP-undecaprenol alpha-1,4-N-acetyl-D-galactosaminyltransferase
MKISLVIHSLQGGGAERVMAGLASRLAGRGHLVTLITLDDATSDRFEISAAVKRLPLGVMSERRGLWAIRDRMRRLVRLRGAIRSAAPDVVLSFCDATNVLVLLAMIGTSIPIVVSERSDPAAQALSRSKSWLRTKLYRRAAAVVVLTPEAAEVVRPWSAAPPVVIPSAVDIPPIPQSSITTPDLGSASNLTGATKHQARRRVIGVGRLEHEKGFDRLVDAFAEVAHRHPQWDLELHGEGSQSEWLRGRVAALGLTDRVRFPGWTRPIWPALASADLFVLPSRYEGFPSALLEAMAAGVPSIAVDCPSGPRAIIRDGVDGLLVKTPSPTTTPSPTKTPSPTETAASGSPAAVDRATARELAISIDRCMADEELRTRLAAAGRAVVDRFGWESMVDAYQNVLEKACRPV